MQQHCSHGKPGTMRAHTSSSSSAAIVLLALVCSGLPTTTLAQLTSADISVDSSPSPAADAASSSSSSSGSSGLDPALAAAIGAPALAAIVPEGSSPSSPASSPAASPSPAAASPATSPSPSPAAVTIAASPPPAANGTTTLPDRPSPSPSPSPADAVLSESPSPASSPSPSPSPSPAGNVVDTGSPTTKETPSPGSSLSSLPSNDISPAAAATIAEQPASNRTAAPTTTTNATTAFPPEQPRVHSGRPFVPFSTSSDSRFAKNYPFPDLPGTIRGPPGCNRVITPNPPVEGDFTDDLNSTLSVSPKRPSADVPVGEWIPGRATFYGADERLEASRVACGEPPAQYGILAQGACGYTNSDGSLPFPREQYAAAADANADYPGSCGRCYQIRCRTGAFENNGRQMRSSDLPFNRGVYVQEDNQGRPWPGSPWVNRDITWTQCWDEEQVITVRIADACPCQYLIQETGEIRHQPWCCGGANHFDISFWAFEKLAHPSYGVMKMEYRPVDCETNAPLRSIPGFVNQTIFRDTIEPGWKWRPYSAKNAQLLVQGQGVDGSVATCASLSQSGAFVFACRQCNATGYQPFAKARTLRFDIRSNTQSDDPFASSTPRGALPPLKLFMMNDEAQTYCGAEVVLGNATTNSTQYAVRGEGDWYTVQIPLSSWQCEKGSVGGLTNVDRVDFQNINERDADVCLDNIALV